MSKKNKNSIPAICNLAIEDVFHASCMTFGS
jgi:hypothetical protein